MPDFLFTPEPNTQAAAFVAGKAAVSRAVFDGLLPELRPYAFTVAGVEDFRVLKRLRDRIADLPRGADWDAVKADLAAELSPFLGEEPAALRRAETLLRTHGYQAYAATHHRTLQAQTDVFPYWEYDTAADERVRSSHAALDGKIFPASSPFWKSHFPPWEWGCRCNVIARSEDDVREIEEADASRVPEARRVLRGERLAKAEQGILLTEENGVPRSVDVRSPREKFGGSGYGFDAGSLGLDLDQLRERYAEQPETWAAFESWARTTKVGGARGTVWEWLEKKLPSKVPADGWPDLAKVKDVQALGGSTGARLVRAPGGAQYVRKTGSSPAHLREEFAADQLYRALGVPTPASKLYETPTGPVKLAEFIEGGRTLGQALQGATAAEQAALLAQAREHFVADALLGNYDVAGLDLDNLLVDPAGKLWRIDNGGALRFRARGAAKAGFGATVAELDSLRDPAINPAAARVFAGLGEAELRDQLRAVIAKRAAVLEATPADLRELLGARFDDLQRRLEALETRGGFTAAFAGQVGEARILGKSHLGDKDMVEDLHVLWFTEKRAGQDVTVARFKLTGTGGAAVKAAHPELVRAEAPADKYWDRLLPIIRHVGHHAGDGVYKQEKLAVLAQLRAELAKEPAGLQAFYLGHLDELAAAVAEKRAPKLLAQWQPPPPETGDGRGELALAPSPWAFVAKSRRRGYAEARETRLLEVDAAIGGKHGPTGAEIRAVLPDAASAPYALRGTVEIAVPGRGGPDTVRAVAEAAQAMGVDLAPATGARRELTYLARNLELLHKTLTPTQRTAWEKIAGAETEDEGSRVQRLRTWVRETLGVDVGDGRAYAADGADNAYGFGFRRWDRWDLPRATVERELADYTLHHRLSGSLPDVIESWLDGGAQVTPTVERLRIGVPISTGMSPSTDLGTGGASYFFTRIKPAAQGRAQPGLTFKIGNLARLDAVSYDSDHFGDVRPKGENTHVTDPRTARGVTLDDYRRHALSAGNETLFKNGLHLLEEVDTIVARTAAEREQVLAVFTRHGYTTLPDGRAIADIVTTPTATSPAKKKKKT